MKGCAKASCKADAMGDSTLCEKHRKARNTYAKNRYKKRVDANLCVRCDRPRIYACYCIIHRNENTDLWHEYINNAENKQKKDLYDKEYNKTKRKNKKALE